MKQHPLLISLPLYGLDQATKWWIVQHIEYRVETVSVIPGFFDLVYWGNTGAAFSAFTGNNYPLSPFSPSSPLAGLLIAYARGSFREPLYRWGVGLLMAGILGNVTDRLNPARQHVVDFLLFRSAPALCVTPGRPSTSPTVAFASPLVYSSSPRSARAGMRPAPVP